MSIKQRVERLRRMLNTEGPCNCGFRVVFEAQELAPPGWVEEPEICPVCGRPKITLRVVFNKGEEENEHTHQSPDQAS